MRKKKHYILSMILFTFFAFLALFALLNRKAITTEHSEFSRENFDSNQEIVPKTESLSECAKKSLELKEFVLENELLFNTVKESLLSLPYAQLKLGEGESVYGLKSPSIDEIKKYSPDLFPSLNQLSDLGLTWVWIVVDSKIETVEFLVCTERRGGGEVLQISIISPPKVIKNPSLAEKAILVDGTDWQVFWVATSMNGI